MRSVLYEYLSDGGEKHWHWDADYPPDSIEKNGKRYVRKGADREVSRYEGPMLGATIGRGYPRVSTAMGVHPSQRAEVNEYCRKNNVPTEHTASGDPILTSRKHEKEYMRARGFCHWNAGYGDAAPSF